VQEAQEQKDIGVIATEGGLEFICLVETVV